MRARIGSRWLPGLVEAVCKEPNSYSIRLVDGRVFRSTRWAINLVQGPKHQLQRQRACGPFDFRREQEHTGVELMTLAPPWTPRSRSSLTIVAPAGSTGVEETYGLLTQQFEIPNTIGGPVSNSVSRCTLEPMRTRSGRQYSRPAAE